MLAGLVAESRHDRIRAIRALELDPHAVYALRRVLFTDRDAEVRASAARRLAGATHVAVEDWLLTAIADDSPLVREAIVRALAIRGGAAAIPVLASVIRSDQMWWIRRSAIYALASVDGAQLATFQAALADPFWRVRHAAVKVLAVLGARDPGVREQITSAEPSSTLTFLRSAWGPIAVETPARVTASSQLPPALLDPDPAVVTARLATNGASPIALVELLCDPHAPLRLLAAELVAASGDHAAYVAALDWLEEPRIPHVADTVEHLLDGLGDPAVEVATRALALADRPGAARWAIGWVIATQYAALYDGVRHRVHVDPTLRRHALRLATDLELVAWAASELVDAIAIELHERQSAALFALDAKAHPRARSLQIDAAARCGRFELVERGLLDPHHGPRAIATRCLVRAGRIDGATQSRDPDPAVREAALTPERACALARDPDPWVRRAAIELLATIWHGESAVPVELEAATADALASPDPWLRAQACRLPIATERLLALLIERAGDRDEMVRSAAHDALEHGSDLDARLRAALPTLADRARAMAYSWLCRAHDEAAIELARNALHAESARAVRTVLAAVAGIELAIVAAEPSRAQVTERCATVEHRRLGRAGFSVAPLAISGAFDLPAPAMHAAREAGVDLWFWEPSYEGLTRFLRESPRSRMIAGSYHADAAAIELDVDRALRRLGRDTLDVFLLFWSRSPARIDPAAFAMLDRIKRTGKVRAVGFSTHHRDLARSAITASPWDVVMIRHSAAHPGIESELLPTACERGTAIITFSALCYGRMVSGPSAPSPADCYRYSLSQPGVTACISAPRRISELVENIAVLGSPTLASEQLASLRAHGIGVRAENQRFNSLMRQPTRDAAAAAREMLAAELPPSGEIEHRRLPYAGASRGARTNLGRTRR